MNTSIPFLASMSVPALLGIASHLGYFIHGEHHMQSVKLAILLFSTPAVLFSIIYQVNPGISVWHTVLLTWLTVSSYLVSLTGSILIYRVFFHPLKRFPGPLSAKLTKLTHVFRLLKKPNNHLQADKLHRKYGEIVRVGPNELTIIIPEAIYHIYGAGSKCTKTAWYDVVGLLTKSLQLERDPVVHSKRRKVWDRAFGAKALRDYESRVIGQADQLVKQLRVRSGEPVDYSLWMNFYSFDTMGDIAFGRTFDMLTTGKKHAGLKALQEGMAPLGIATPIPWAIPILQALPQPSGIDDWVNFADRQIEARKKYKPEKPDIMTWLIEAEKEHPDPFVSDPRWLWGDTRLVIVAGSDTSSSALTHIFYHIAKEPHIATKLREELSTFYKPGSDTELRDLQEAKSKWCYQREFEAFPSGAERGHETHPTRRAHYWRYFYPWRTESCFKHAKEFLPERWGDKAELVLDRSVSIPFASGAYSCIGKQLALMELRIVTARLVTEFDIKFAPGENGRVLLEETKDVFTMEVAPLVLILTRLSA